MEDGCDSSLVAISKLLLYHISDDSYTMTINVTAVNDLPTGSNVSVTANEDTAHAFGTGDFTFNDADGHTFKGIKIATAPTQGTLMCGNTAMIKDSQCTDVTTLAYTPASEGNDSFTFYLIDSSGTASDVAYTMSIDIAAWHR